MPATLLSASSSTQLQLNKVSVSYSKCRLSEELVRASTEAQQGSAAQQRVEALEAELTELRRRHDACLQLLGETAFIVALQPAYRY